MGRISQPTTFGASREIVANEITTTSDSSFHEKMAAATAKLGSLGGVIKMYSEGDVNDIDALIELPTNHVLELKSGNYQHRVISTNPNAPACSAFLLQNGSMIKGDINTVLIEPAISDTYFNEDSDRGAAALTMVRMKGSYATGLQYSNNLSGAAYNVLIDGLTFLGNRANRIAYNKATIHLCNTHNGVIQRCQFLDTSAHAARMGIANGAGNQTQMAVARALGQYAEFQRFTRNICKNLGSQNVAVDNGTNISIDNNWFVAGSRAPFTVVSAVSNGDGTTTFTTSEAHNFQTGDSIGIKDLAGGSWASATGHYLYGAIRISATQVKVGINSAGFGSYTANSGVIVNGGTEQGAIIDIEAEYGLGASQNFYQIRVHKNDIDLRDTYRTIGGIAVSANPAGHDAPGNGHFEGAFITENNIVGAVSPTTQGVLSGGITIGANDGQSNTDYIVVHKNTIIRADIFGIYATGRYHTISENTIRDSGNSNHGAGNFGGIFAQNLSNSLIARNEVTNTVFGQAAQCYENGINTDNRWIGNILGGRESYNTGGIVHLSGSLVTYSYYGDSKCFGTGSVLAESASSNHNQFDNNLSDLAITKVGANSTIVTHKRFDGTVTDRNGKYLYGSNDIPPVVSITAPASGAILSGATNAFTATVLPGTQAVRGVQFYIDGTPLGSEDTTPSSYSANIDVTGWGAGSVHELSAKATDVLGNSTTATCIVTKTTAGLTNYGLATAGATATATATDTTGGTFSPAMVIDGHRHTNSAWGTNGGWQGPASSFPESVTVNLNQTRSLQVVNVFTIANQVNYSTDPVLNGTNPYTDLATTYGATDYLVEYYDGSLWHTVSSVTGNTQAFRMFAIPSAPVSATKVRVTVSASADGGAARLVEIEPLG